jgi:hypothetical protein
VEVYKDFTSWFFKDNPLEIQLGSRACHPANALEPTFWYRAAEPPFLKQILPKISQNHVLRSKKRLDE